MNLRDLEYLVAVSETLHFRRAAEQCFVSQPTLSGQISKLETEIGVSLLERTNKSVKVTPIGQKVIGHARQILEQTEAIRNLAQAHLEIFSSVTDTFHSFQKVLHVRTFVYCNFINL